MPTFPPLLAAWFHDLSPFAVRFTETFGVRWYGLSYVAGFIAAWWLLGRLARRGLILVKAEAVGDVMLAVIVGTIVGGRAGYILIYRPDLLTEFTPRFPFWGALDLMHGGMASHGAMVGIIIGCWLAARRCRVRAVHVMDCICLAAPIGTFFGRIANFVNGELLGRIVAQPADIASGITAAPWWGVRFPQELLERGGESQLDAVQTMSLNALLAPHGDPAALDLAPAAATVIEKIQSGDQMLAAQLEPFISVRHPSQLYQAFAEGIVVFVVLWLVWARPRKPGVILGCFFIAYGVGRVLTEFWRLPDAHLATQRLAGLSRGQWLSVLMVAAGFAVLAWARRAVGERVGGWASAARAN